MMGGLGAISLQTLTTTAPADDWHPDNLVIDPPHYVADELNTTVSTLQRWRSEGIGPPFVKLGRRKIGYPRGPRRQWLRMRLFKSTAEARERP
jgi:hypothetical protein